MPDSSQPRRPWLAAILSFLFPGLGQAYAGRWRLAMAFATPVLLLAAAVVASLTVFADRVRLDIFSSSFIIGVLVLDAALFAWRSAAIAQAGLVPSSPDAAPEPTASRRRGRDVGTVIVLLVLTVAMHAYVGVVLGALDQTLAQVFAGGEERPPPTDGGTTDEPDDPEEPINEPDYHWDGTERVNFLLLGVDSGPGREEALTDTILVVSIDPADESAVMVSIPRDTGFVPLPDRRIYPDGLFPEKINALSSVAEANGDLWCPDLISARACGLRTLERTVGLYLGIPIHYYATVDLTGFAELIDALGGVELCLPGTLVDPEYSGPTWAPRYGIELPAGCHRYGGAEALAFARIRKGWIELPNGEIDYQNDFERADRQQEVLLALRRELADANLVFELPGILEAVGRTVSTDFPREQAGNLASLLPLITGPEIERTVLGYPDYVDEPVDPESNYLLLPIRDAIRDAMSELFGTGLEGWYLGTSDELPPIESDPADPSATPAAATRGTRAGPLAEA
jgi:LCP family protein required for cell wall assembly